MRIVTPDKDFGNAIETKNMPSDKKGRRERAFKRGKSEKGKEKNPSEETKDATQCGEQEQMSAEPEYDEGCDWDSNTNEGDWKDLRSSMREKYKEAIETTEGTRI